MWVVLKNKFKRTGPLVMGGGNSGVKVTEIDRIVDTLDEVKSGEVFIKCNVKK